MFFVPQTRQWSSLELIASENFTSRAVMDCLGSALTNKVQFHRSNLKVSQRDEGQKSYFTVFLASLCGLFGLRVWAVHSLHFMTTGSRHENNVRDITKIQK